MRFGAYRHVVDIDDPVSTQDASSGAVAITWSRAHSAVPASVLTGPGRERVVGEAKLSDVDIRVWMRWFGGLDPRSRIVWDGVPYDIISIETDATNRREYRLTCKRGVSIDGR